MELSKSQAQKTWLYPHREDGDGKPSVNRQNSMLEKLIQARRGIGLGDHVLRGRSSSKCGLRNIPHSAIFHDGRRCPHRAHPASVGRPAAISARVMMCWHLRFVT
jgi:hypothetical protein